MNMTNNRYEEEDPDYQAESQAVGVRGGVEKINRQQRRPSYKSKNAPAGFNGIHRRRNKRSGW